MELNEAILGRRSVRDYTGEAVEETTIQHLIGAAVHAPSAVNEQPWTFTVVRDQALLARISRDAKDFMRQAPPRGPQAKHIRPLVEDEEFHIFYHAPVLVVIAANAEGPWIIEDCALAAENLMLAAHGEGLGTCWIGLSQDFLNTDEGKRMLGLPAEWIPVAPIILGHPRLPAQPVPRKEPEIRWVG